MLWCLAKIEIFITDLEDEWTGYPGKTFGSSIVVRIDFPSISILRKTKSDHLHLYLLTGETKVFYHHQKESEIVRN